MCLTKSPVPLFRPELHAWQACQAPKSPIQPCSLFNWSLIKCYSVHCFPGPRCALWSTPRFISSNPSNAMNMSVERCLEECSDARSASNPATESPTQNESYRWNPPPEERYGFAVQVQHSLSFFFFSLECSLCLIHSVFLCRGFLWSYVNAASSDSNCLLPGVLNLSLGHPVHVVSQVLGIFCGQRFYRH